MQLSKLKNLLIKEIPLPYVHLFAQLNEGHINLTEEIEILFYLLVYERERGNLALHLQKSALLQSLQDALQQVNENLAETFASLAEQLSHTDVTNCNFVAVAAPTREPDGKPLVLYDDYLYFHREYTAVKSVSRELDRLRCAQQPFHLKKYYAIADDISRTMDYPLNPEQKLAFATAINSFFTVITGGPGTGKSSIVKYLIHYFLQVAPENEKVFPDQIRLCAPTGKAANRLQESLGSLASDIFCGTIHRTLEYRKGKYRYCLKNPLPASLVIVDEVSMIDISLMNSLLCALPANCRLIFLGDRNQLPPVGSGAMLAELVPDFNACRYDNSLQAAIKESGGDVQQPTGAKTVSNVIFLTRNMREDEKNRNLKNSISSLASDILENRQENIRTFLEQFTVDRLEAAPAGCSRLQKINDNLMDILLSFCRSLYQRTLMADKNNPTEIKKILSAAKILTFLREGKGGAVYLNQNLNRLLAVKNESFFPGQHIMVTANDPITQLNNGDTGIVIDFPGEGPKAGFIKNDTVRWFYPNQLPAWETAWCITVHKSQGSEYNEVLILLPHDSENRMTYRELLYTAITRARHKAILIGSDEVILAAAFRQFRRENGYPFWEMKP